MPQVMRYKLCRGIWMDTGALPCPRCRSTRLTRESHPATGTMVSCHECGARGHEGEWNDGEVQYQRVEGKTHYVSAPQQFQRPSTDRIIKTSRSKVLKMRAPIFPTPT